MCFLKLRLYKQFSSECKNKLTGGQLLILTKALMFVSFCNKHKLYVQIEIKN